MVNTKNKFWMFMDKLGRKLYEPIYFITTSTVFLTSLIFMILEAYNTYKEINNYSYAKVNLLYYLDCFILLSPIIFSITLIVYFTVHYKIAKRNNPSI